MYISVIRMFRLLGCGGGTCMCTVVLRSMGRQRKRRPATTILAAKERHPIRESKSAVLGPSAQERGGTGLYRGSPWSLFSK